MGRANASEGTKARAHEPLIIKIHSYLYVLRILHTV